MLDSASGKVTYPGFLFDNLASQARFHDPNKDTIFSHSQDIFKFSQWRSRSSSREASPIRNSTPIPTASSRALHVPGVEDKETYLAVKTPKGVIKLPSLQTPHSSGKRVRYCIYEYETLVDSSDLGFKDWIRMASDIEANYQAYDAFIILHGTDTMAYSVSLTALSRSAFNDQPC